MVDGRGTAALVLDVIAFLHFLRARLGDLVQV